MSDYRVFNDNGYERTWEELYEDNVRFQKYTDKLEKENQELKMINEEYERLNKEKYRGFKIIDVQEYDRYELLSYKNYKENWIKLKEYLNYKSERAVGEDEYVYDEIYNEMQELEGNDSNEI